jgi:hypothetical protein
LQVTSFLHSRKTTWALGLWSGYIATWAVITGPGPAMVTLWWLVGIVVFSPVWFAAQPVFRRARGLDGVRISPGWRAWRVVDLHRTNPGTESRRDAG